MEEDWSATPYQDFPDQIAKRLPCIRDFLRFSLVCNSWRSLLTVQNNYLLQSDHNPPFSKGIPCLMLTETSSDDNATRGFYNLSTNNRYNLSLPEAQGRRCWGTHYGWLITVGIDREMHLLNPLTRARIQLPAQSTFKDQFGCYRGPEEVRTYFVRKAVLGLDGDYDDQFIVMALYSQRHKLAFARPGDKAWTTIEDAPLGGYKDFICFKGQFYAINTVGEIYVCDLSDPHHSKATYFAPATEDVCQYHGFYLLEMAGELHMVVRYYDNDMILAMPFKCNRYATCLFEVYKVDLCTRELIELVDGFIGYTIFVGNNSSFSISAAEHPEFKGNCIYFTDDSYQGYDTGRDMGIFDYKEDTIIPLYIGQDCISSFLPPTVFIPNW